MFWSIWQSSDVKIFSIRTLLSSVVNIYTGPFGALVCWSWCVVFFLAVCFAVCLVPEQEQEHEQDMQQNIQQGRTQCTNSNTQTYKTVHVTLMKTEIVTVPAVRISNLTKFVTFQEVSLVSTLSIDMSYPRRIHCI
jgi:hypothetical protein